MGAHYPICIFCAGDNDSVLQAQIFIMNIKQALASIDSTDRYLLAALLAIGVVGGAIALPFSYVSGSNVLIGFCLFPFILFFKGNVRFNFMYLVAMLFFGTVAYAYNLKIFFFLAIAFYVLFLLEIFLGEVNPIIFFLIGLMSPIVLQVFAIMGFPIRLQLSAWTGKLLTAAGFSIQVEGNMMLLGGESFAVDDACMGLNMLVISMLMGVFVMAHLYYVKRSTLSLTSLTLFFLAVFALNIFANLMRIMILVVFTVPPEDPMHEVIGVAGLVIYVVMPLYFLARWMMGRFGKPVGIGHQPRSFQHMTKIVVLFLAVGVIVLSIRLHYNKNRSPVTHAQVSFRGLQTIKMKDGITKIVDDELLIYIKPIPEFFTGEHTPLLCWKGSGYKFGSIKKITIGEREFYSGELQKEGATLYTAWWYNNGKINTVNQWDWRSRMFKGEARFCLVNVTAKDEGNLTQSLHAIFEKDLLTINSQQ
jgi:exosortase N